MSNTKKQASEDAQALAERVGGGWKPEVWQNLGWHYKVVSPCGRVKIHPSSDGSFTCFLSDDDGAGGIFVEHGSTPLAALKATLVRAYAERAKINALIAIGEGAFADGEWK